MPQAAGIAEIVLWSHDAQAMARFYTELFELEQISPPNIPNIFLKVADGRDSIPQMIVVVPHPNSQETFPRAKTERVLHHLALSVTPEAYDEIAERCRARGLEVRDGTHPVLKNVRTFYVDDPEGNEVEVIAPV